MKFWASIVAKQVTCDSCRRSFLVPDQIGDYWVLCPHCEKVNPRARPEIESRPTTLSRDSRSLTFIGCTGSLFFLAGILGATIGTFLVHLAVTLDSFWWKEEWQHGWQHLAFLLTAIWFFASAALIVAGSLLLRTDAEAVDLSWRKLTGVLMALIAGIGGWLFVLETCKY
jgi:hypothetical protein